MSWETKHYIFEVLGSNKLNAREIMARLESINVGTGECYETLTKYLKKLSNRKQLERLMEKGRYYYWNPVECEKSKT